MLLPFQVADSAARNLHDSYILRVRMPFCAGRIAVGGDSFACMSSFACRGRVRLLACLLACLLCMLGAVLILHYACQYSTVGNSRSCHATVCFLAYAFL
jgi:hypothetical protein